MLPHEIEAEMKLSVPKPAKIKPAPKPEVSLAEVKPLQQQVLPPQPQLLAPTTDGVQLQAAPTQYMPANTIMSFVQQAAVPGQHPVTHHYIDEVQVAPLPLVTGGAAAGNAAAYPSVSVFPATAYQHAVNPTIANEFSTLQMTMSNSLNTYFPNQTQPQ